MISQLSIFKNPLNSQNMWAVQQHHTRFVVIPKPKSIVSNTCTFVKTVLQAEKILKTNKSNASTTSDTHLILKNIVREYINLTLEIEKQSFLKRVALKIVVFVSFGTTISRTVEKLRHTAVVKHQVPNDFSARILYSELMHDAEIAASDPLAYGKIADKYKNVKKMKWYTLHNNLIKELKNTGCKHWQAARQLLKAGKSFNDKEVVAQCDLTMEIFRAMAELSAKGEWDLIHPLSSPLKDHRGSTPEQIRGYLLTTQNFTATWVHVQFSNFYMWLRSCPTYDKNYQKTLNNNIGNSKEELRWIGGIYLDPSRANPFYQEGTSQIWWRKSWNEYLELLKTKIDLDWCLKKDHRFYTEEDTHEFLDKSKAKAPMIKFLYQSPYLADDYIIKQLLPNW